MKSERGQILQFRASSRNTKTGEVHQLEGINPTSTEGAQDSNNVIYLSGNNGDHFLLARDLQKPNKRWKSDNPIEPSAVLRLHTILKLLDKQDFCVALAASGQRIDCKIVAISNPTLPYFKGQVSDETKSPIKGPIQIDFDLYGMKFSFETETIEYDPNQRTFIAHLPKNASRKLTRSSPRTSGASPTIFEKGKFESALKFSDISVNGLALTHNTSDWKIGETKTLLIKFPSSVQYEVRALIVGQTDERYHLSLSIPVELRKSWLATLLMLQYPGINVSYDAERAWQCLLDFKYLDLIETPSFKTSNEQCKAAWRALADSPNFFQPALDLNGALGGTYGVVRQSQDHWVQQALATRVDPAYLGVTAALYTAWPQYVLMENQPFWVTTQFDSEKKWHNRYFGVFANEAKNSPHFNTFTKHWFWSCHAQDNKLPSAVELTPYQDAPEEIKKRASEVLGSFQKISNPWFFTIPSKTNGIETRPMIGVRGNEFLGVVLFVLSDQPINPFAVFHVGHVFTSQALDPDQRLAATKELIAATHNLLKATRQTSCAITHDYDLDPNATRPVGYEYFCATSFQNHTEYLIPSFLSVCAMNLADMELRYRAP